MLATWVKTLYRVFSLTWPASMQIYWNKRKQEWMLPRWKYPKNYLDIFWGALGINKNMTCFFCVPTNPWAGLCFRHCYLLLNGVGINKKMILFFGVYCNISSCASNNAQWMSDVLFWLLVTCNTTYACKTTSPFIVGREISDCFTSHRVPPHLNSTPAANRK